MSIHLTRRALWIATPQIGLLSAQSATSSAAVKAVDRGPALATDLVKEFVVAARGNLPRTKELLERHPGPPQ